MMAAYAATTSVPVERSRQEIEYTLTRYGADSFAHATNPKTTAIMFRVQNRTVKIVLDKADHPQEERRRWRALLLVLKAKLEAIASGISTFDDEFLPFIVMPNGQTVGEWAKPQLAQMQAGKMLLGLPEGD